MKDKANGPSSKGRTADFGSENEGSNPSGRANCPHRLVGKIAALSRRRPGFKSPWGRHLPVAKRIKAPRYERGNWRFESSRAGYYLAVVKRISRVPPEDVTQVRVLPPLRLVARQAQYDGQVVPKNTTSAIVRWRNGRRYAIILTSKLPS